MAEGLLAVGSQAPVFEAETRDGGPVSLPALLEERAELLTFYPKDDTPGCTKQKCTAGDEGVEYARGEGRQHLAVAAVHIGVAVRRAVAGRGDGEVDDVDRNRRREIGLGRLARRERLIDLGAIPLGPLEQ